MHTLIILHVTKTVYICSGSKFTIFLSFWIGLIAKLYSDINMHAYTNFTSYDKKLFIYIQGRLALMWQQSGTLLFCSCHGIAGFLVDALQI